MDSILLKQVNHKFYHRAPEKDFDGVKVFKVEGEDSTLYYWNSSNGQSIRHTTALTNILDYLADGDEGGTVYDGWNEIMFEVE